jgi:hypothetical protein
MKKLVVVAVAAVVVVVAIIGGRAVLSQRSKSAVGYLGDSITDQARPTLESDLAADPDKVKAVGGIKIEEMVIPAQDLAALHPEQVVINLGTNNVLAIDPVDQEATSLQQLVDTFPAARCVHVVTINEHMASPPPKDLKAGAEQLNERIRAMAAADSRVRVVDWAKVVDDYDAAGDPDGPLTSDTVHPVGTGEKLLIDAYRRSIDAC